MFSQSQVFLRFKKLNWKSGNQTNSVPHIAVACKIILMLVAFLRNIFIYFKTVNMVHCNKSIHNFIYNIILLVTYFS